MELFRLGRTKWTGSTTSQQYTTSWWVYKTRDRGELIDFDDINMESVTKLFQLSFYQNLQECYIIADASSENQSDITIVLIQLIKLQHLKILDFSIRVFLYKYPGGNQSKKSWQAALFI